MNEIKESFGQEGEAAFFGVCDKSILTAKSFWRISTILLLYLGLVPLSGHGQQTPPNDDQFLKDVIEGISSPPPAVEEKRVSYSFISDTRRLYSKDPVNQKVETLKTTLWTAGKDKVFIYQEIIFPSPPLFIKIQTPDQLWYLSCTKKWAAQSDNYVPIDKTPKDVSEVFSYFADIKYHPDSKYRLAREDDETWTIDEKPSIEFKKTMSKYISSFGKVAGVAPEITESPDLELIRLVVDKNWQLPVLVEIYGKSGAMWYQRKIKEINQVPLDQSLFDLPKGCKNLGMGSASLQEMFSLEKEEKIKGMSKEELKKAKQEEKEKGIKKGQK